MENFVFRINKYTYIREFSGYYYMENQVSHVHATLKKEGFEWLSDTDNCKGFAFNDICAGSGNKTELFNLFQQLNKAWLIDIEHLSDVKERRFSYANKSKIESTFSDFSPIVYGDVIGGHPFLNNLQIELTDICNERCIHCYLPHVKKNEGTSLTEQQVMDVLRQYRKMEGLKVVFSGGEILLHTSLFRILDECKRLNLMILLQTNLVSLTKENIAKIKSLEVFNVQISLYSTDERIHEAITQRKGSYARTKRNLELLVENNIPVMISCPVMDINFPTVRSLHDYASNLGVDLYFDYIMMAECNGCCDNLKHRLNDSQIVEMTKLRIETTPMLLDAISQSPSLEVALSKKYARRRTMCSILSASLCIDSDGTYYPCPGWNGMKLGNTHTVSLSEVWNSEQANALRKVSQNDDFKRCAACTIRNFCDMCAVYNYNENHDLHEPCTLFCKIATILKESVTEKYYELHQ